MTHGIFKKSLLISMLTLLTIGNSIAQREVGLFTNQMEAFNGYTLIAPSVQRQTVLIDNCGREINRWTSSHNPGLAAYLQPNGDLLRTIRIPGSFAGGGIGGGVELISWEGDLLWHFEYANEKAHQHHDITALPNGNILILAWEKFSAAEAQSMGILNPYPEGIWPEHIVEVHPIFPDSAEIVWEWHLIDHIIQDIQMNAPNFGIISDHPELIDVHFTTIQNGEDFVHANAIDYNPELDQIMINSRNYREFWVIDHSTTTEEAAGHTGGQSGKGGDILYRWGNPQVYQRGGNDDIVFYGQHDAHWIPKGLPNEGKIMVYNNGAQSPENISKIQLLDPPIQANGNYILETGKSFGPESPFRTIDEIPGEGTFLSARISGAQMQPNGNILICNGVRGNLYEVTEDSSLVWKYLNPLASSPLPFDSQAGGRGMFRAYRYGSEYSAFVGKDLTPGDVIELNAPASDCEIFLSTGIEPTTRLLTGVDLNLLSPYEMVVAQSTFEDLYVDMFNIQGQRINGYFINQPIAQITIPHVVSGIYLFRISNSKGQFNTWKVFIP